MDVGDVHSGGKIRGLQCRYSSSRTLIDVPHGDSRRPVQVRRTILVLGDRSSSTVVRRHHPALKIFQQFSAEGNTKDPVASKTQSDVGTIPPLEHIEVPFNKHNFNPLEILPRFLQLPCPPQSSTPIPTPSNPPCNPFSPKKPSAGSSWGAKVAWGKRRLHARSPSSSRACANPCS